jgi:hypothetical protein
MDFVIDTNCLINFHGYSSEVFPSLWENFHSMINSGEIVSLEEVRGELGNSHGNLITYWNDIDSNLKSNGMKFFYELVDDDLDYLSSIEQFEEFIKAGKDKPVYADPFLVAFAINRDCILLTDERRPNSPKSIPFVCNKLNINSMNLTEFMIHQGWKW